MIVAVTEHGKVCVAFRIGYSTETINQRSSLMFQIFGIDNMSGKYHWIKHLPNFKSFNEHQSLKIFVQRTSRHFPNPPMCVVVGKNKVKCIVSSFKPNVIWNDPYIFFLLAIE